MISEKQKRHLTKLAKLRLGKKHTEESKEKIRRSAIGRTRKPFSKEHKEKIRQKMLQWWIDNPHQKIWAKERFSGENSNFWEGGKSKISSLLRSSSEYREWRIKVFHRDCFRCVWCGDKHKIEADHIKPFAYFPELRFNVDNGRTLCKECHKKTDTYLIKARKYKQNA